MIHHLVVDGVSWRILVPDLAESCHERELIELNFRHFGFEFDASELDGAATAVFARFRDHLRGENMIGR